MIKSVVLAVILIAGTATATSKDKAPKVTYHDMAIGMRDAFNCGVVIEEHMHGRLKDDSLLYSKERAVYNCDHVEAVLNTLDDQNGTPKP